MAFFKFRKRGDAAASASTAAQASPAESVEAMRKRARQRLIGAAVLVLAGVVGFPLLFDTQPRPIAVDIPIDIPDRAKGKPLPAKAIPAAAGPVATDAPPPAAAVKADAPAVLAPAPAPAPAAVPVAAVTSAAPAAAPAATPAKPASAPVTAPAKPASATTKPDAAPPKADAKDADRALALLEGKDSHAADGRFVVQVGAFADAAKAASVRQKLEKAGLKTYTHVAETKEGKRIRVRLGPFGTKAEADKAAAKAKGLDLQATVLTL